METVHGSHKASKPASEEEFISNMPENVITNILERLPIQDAVRTSILSTDWRFNWTMLTKLVFDKKFFELGSAGKSDQNERNISRILFQLKGFVIKFDLIVPFYKTLDIEEVGLWVMLLSTKGIKEFTVLNYYKTPLKLPTHLYSCLELTHLSLYNCCFHPPPSFHGFPNLLILLLSFVRFESYRCGELITRCPLLNALRISDCILSGKVKLAEIAKLKNLSGLRLPLSTLEITPFTSSSIFQFAGFFPKLWVLRLDFRMCKFLAETVAKKDAPTSFSGLKGLYLLSIDFANDVMVSYVFDMICCSPNLQTLRISTLPNNDVPPFAICSSALGRKTMGQLRLHSVVFKQLRGSENEVCLIKSLLACSPLLKTMCIEFNSSSMVGGADGKFMFAKRLLNLYRASPVAKIELL